MDASSSGWPARLPVAQVRIARPTDRFGEIIRFYGVALGLPERFRFTDHAGYDGIMFGLPGTEYHLEFTTHVDGSPCPAPTRDNLLVLSFDDAAQRDVVAARLARYGYGPVEAENPYWTEHGGITVEDPDGWRIVLMPARMLRDEPTMASGDAYAIRRARPDELARLREIEDAAGSMFDGLGLADEALDSSFPHDERARLVALGQAWVACTSDDLAVGAVFASERDGAGYVEELDVVPAHGRRGLGRRLLAEVLEWAGARGLTAVALATFRDVPWNGPFYRSQGFRELDDDEWTPSMHAIRETEEREGLAVEHRVFMRCDLQHRGAS